MTENRLQKYLERETLGVEGSKIWKPVIFSDSKASYLERFKCNECIGNDILWNIYRGGNSSYITRRVKDTINNLEASYGKVHVYLWTGTCDFTKKNNRLIDLQDNTEQALRTLSDNLLQLEEFFHERSSAKLTILHTPYYSIRKWNTHNDDDATVTEVTEESLEKDQELKRLVDVSNGVIDQINQRLGTRSPKLNLDIERPYKKKNHLARANINWGLFKDGVHPDNLLAKAWLRSICKQIISECY